MTAQAAIFDTVFASALPGGGGGLLMWADWALAIGFGSGALWTWGELLRLRLFVVAAWVVCCRCAGESVAAMVCRLGCSRLLVGRCV